MNWLYWALLPALFAGVTAVLAKVGISGLNSNLATAIRTTVVLGFTWGIAFATSKPSTMLEISRRSWWFLGLSGITTGLSWLCYFRAIQLGEVSRVAPVDKLSVIFVMAFAALFLNEPWTLQHWIGGGLNAAGAIVLAWS